MTSRQGEATDRSQDGGLAGGSGPRTFAEGVHGAHRYEVIPHGGEASASYGGDRGEGDPFMSPVATGVLVVVTTGVLVVIVTRGVP